MLIVTLAATTNIMAFQNWIFNQLPTYFKKFDTYKDLNGRGLLERFLEALGLELDQELIPPLENYLDITDTSTAPSEHIVHISYTLGRPPNFFTSEAEYRKFLSFILSLYKIKGTLKSYQALLAYFNYQVNLITEFPPCVTYDTEFTYDEDGTAYDTCCEPCVKYKLILSQPGAPCLPSPGFTWDLTNFEAPGVLGAILCLVEPINAKLEEVIPGIFACESFQGAINETVVVELIDYVLYDDNDSFDTTESVYDTPNVNIIQIYP